MDIEKELRNHDLIVTPARIAILSILKESSSPLTLDAIKASLIEDGLTINQSTVYRTLDQFKEVGMILKSTPKQPFQPLYEYRDGTHSHYLICTNCGIIKRIDDCPIHQYEDKIAQEQGYIIHAHRLELYGICSMCQQEIQ